MQAYNNINGSMGVCSYESGKDNIRIKLHTRKTYVYDYKYTGEEHVNNMKELAAKGAGLNHYIKNIVKDQYAFVLD